jgi:hypothetical protein
MIRIAIRYGSLSGIILVCLMFATGMYWGENIDFGLAEKVGYVTMVLGLSMIYIGTRDFRNIHHMEHFSFGKGLLAGLFITLVASCFYVAGWMVYSTTLDPDFMDRYYEYSVDQLKSKNLSDEKLNVKLDQMSKYKEVYKSPVIQILISFFEILPVGFLMSVVFAFILRKRKSQLSV